MLEMRILPFFFLVLSFPLHAEIYAWREGASLKLSNDAPGWYRLDGPVRGPRVVVMQGKQVVDDTGLPLEERQTLRVSFNPKRPRPVRRYVLPNY